MIRWAESRTAAVQVNDELIFPMGRHVIAKQTKTEEQILEENRFISHQMLHQDNSDIIFEGHSNDDIAPICYSDLEIFAQGEKKFSTMKSWGSKVWHP